jgi:phosphonate transport system permease protein
VIARDLASGPFDVEAVLTFGRRRTLRRGFTLCACALAILWAFGYAGAFDTARYRDALRTIFVLAGDACPPDFSRWRNWGRPLLETIAMSIAGTVLAGVAGLLLGGLAARNVAPACVSVPAQFLLNVIRAIPDLIWGVLFVAAVGFGPLPGVLALACHSTGMLGKFFAEILEHIDPAPGDALRSQGVPPLGILRFAVWPQILPRLVDVTLYRWEHNLRAATVLGVIGAGGIGLELVTAFHLFEYREALALIIVMLGLVTAITAVGSQMRRRFLDGD